MGRFDEINATEKAFSQDPRAIDGYAVTWSDDEYVIELFNGNNVYQTIPGWPHPHKTPEAAHAHARRLGYSPL